MSFELHPPSLDTVWLGRQLRVVAETTSTNSALADWAAAGAPHGAIVIAARQTAGRGRQGRAWESVPGNLFVSWLLRPKRTMGEMAPLSLVTGLGVARVVREVTRADVAGIKWPNDVWVDSKKIAGVLLESRVQPSPAIVVGLGLNLVTPAGGWGPTLIDRAIALDEIGVRITPNAMLELLLPHVERDIERFEREGLAGFADELVEFSVLDGRRIMSSGGTNTEELLVLGIGPDGGLRVRDGNGEERTLHAGEVHLAGVSS